MLNHRCGPPQGGGRPEEPLSQQREPSCVSRTLEEVPPHDVTRRETVRKGSGPIPGRPGLQQGVYGPIELEEPTFHVKKQAVEETKD